MKYLVASDLHGSLDYTKQLLTRFDEEKADWIILLGDLYYHGPRNPLSQGYNPMEVARLLNMHKERLVVVRGNCDSEVDQMISEFRFRASYTLNIGDRKTESKTIFFTHGHKYNQANPPQKRFDVLVYGHEHTGFIRRSEGKLFVNAGSVSLPKNGTAHSCLIIEGKKIALMDLSGRLIDEVVI